MPLVNLKKLNNFSTEKNKKNRKRWLILALVLFLGLILPFGGIFLSSKELLKNGKYLMAVSKQENLDQIKTGVKGTRGAVENLNIALNFLFWVRAIPFVGGYYSDVKHFAKAAEYELAAAESVIVSLDPYKNELGLTGQTTAGQDRVAQAVKILNKILPNIDQVEPYLQKAKKEVEGIDTNKYPESLGSFVLKRKIEQAKDLIIGTHIALTEGKEALQVSPSVLGESSPKTYLLLFQNDKELRPTGGFITAYAFLKLDKGKFSTSSSDDIYQLDEKLLKICLNKICPLTPPAPIVRYLPETTGKQRTAWSMRDSNISPDFPTAAKEFERMYELLGEGLPFDGIIAIDTQVVEELITLTGPVEALGTTYSASLDKRCNCPNVIYELEHYAEVAAKGEADRKAVVGTLMQQILARSLGAEPQKMPDFLTTGIRLANDKHILFYMHDQKTQTALNKLGWTGEIKKNQGDYLHINDSNFAGGKSNLYVEEKVTMEIDVDKTGAVKNRVTIEYKNPQPFNIWLNGILRDYVRIYAPLGSQLVNSKGSEVTVTTQEDEVLGKTYFEAFITVRPQNSRTLSFEYTLPDKFTGKNYPLLIQKQPGAKDHQYIIKINGSKKAEFDLTSDKKLNLSF